ncbi:MAG TPA: nicotinate (nicotinamide) nucleotide adenylyltransferase [Opitutae bacterium]|nr:nicotinate (nicotinamide) nucleotide adenylyltransferase [Opitutae bacterium]
MSGQNAEIQRMALFGGSFDPVHNGHLTIARYALKQVGLDRIVFMPAACSPLKGQETRVSDDARAEMLELATHGESRFKVDTYELERGGVSYTIDTVEYFRANYPNTELYFMIGADQFELLDQWRRIEDLAQLVTFLVFGRPGSSVQACAVAGLHYLEVDAPLMEASSSEIRTRCQKKQSIQDLVPPAVEAFISDEGLYTDLD